MNANLEETKLSSMDIMEVRRDRLREWVASHSTPTREKSYFSQLIGGSASFGEKAARRLERDYGMGEGYLDSTISVAILTTHATDHAPVAATAFNTLTLDLENPNSSDATEGVQPPFSPQLNKLVDELIAAECEGVLSVDLVDALRQVLRASINVKNRSEPRNTEDLVLAEGLEGQGNAQRKGIGKRQRR